MSLEGDLTPRTCSNYVEDPSFTYCETCVKVFQQARPKCPNFETCGKHVKYSYPLRKNLGTCVDCMPAQGPPCPFCTGYRMINSQTGQPFKTCYHCRFKCPNYSTCGGYRGQSGGGYRYPLCSKCKYGTHYRAPPAKTVDPALAATTADPEIV